MSLVITSVSDTSNRFMHLTKDDTRDRMNTAVTLCILALLSASGQFSVCAGLSGSHLIQGNNSLVPGAYWALSSSWKWSATGASNNADWRVEREDWNDTIAVEKASTSELLLKLDRIGRGSVNASGSFIIANQSSDSWNINRQYSLSINASSLLGPDNKPLRWIVSEKELRESGSVPQMWTDRDYSYIEVKFRVTGSEQVMVRGIPVDAWVVSYRNLTTGYWSKAGNHSVGFKEETLSYDKKVGLLLRDAYNGTYSVRTEEGWHEIETFTSSIVDSNLDFSQDDLATNPTNLMMLGAGVAAVVIAILTVITYRRRQIRLSTPVSLHRPSEKG